VLQCVAVCCSVLQCVHIRLDDVRRQTKTVRKVLCVALRCSMLQCVAVCCSAVFSVVQCVAVWCCVLQCMGKCDSFVWIQLDDVRR